jgi:prolyl-tRNA synthetase
LDLGGGAADDLYRDLQKAGIEVLYDDREVSAGVKFTDADLIGIPLRLVVSRETGGKVEVKPRAGKEIKLMTKKELLELLNPKP